MRENTLTQFRFYQLLFISFAFFLLGAIKSSAQSCNAELKVEKDRNFKSAAEDGATYTLLLTNKSSKTETFKITTKMVEASCANNTRPTRQPNVRLNVGITKNDGRSALSNGLQVSPGETKKFIVQVDAPAGTPAETWGCVEVQAVPETCRTQSFSTILSVYVPDTTAE